MSDESPSTAYQLTPPVDFRAAHDLLGQDHLIVDAHRMLVIFRNTVLDIAVCDGDLETAELVVVEVLDAPPQAAETGNTLLERFLEHLETTTGADWVEAPET